MPIYEYRCGACGFEKEYLQRISDAPLTDCPQCGKSALKKLVSAAGFQLKGTGWYVTDFRNNGSKPAKPEKAADAAKPAEGAGKETSTSGPSASSTASAPASPATAAAS
jgi:putative FmdB family regulatory protein